MPKTTHKRFIHQTLIMLLTLVSFSAMAQSNPKINKATASTSLEVEQMTTDLGVIWAMDFISQDEIIFTIRDGKAGIFNIKTKQVTWLKGLPEVFDMGQGGLLDVAVSPVTNKRAQITQEANNQLDWIYFTYSKPDGFQGKTTLAKAQLVNNQLINWQDLLITQSGSLRNIHFGSRIAFDNLGHVFFSIGDRGGRDKAQNTKNHAGTILRLNLDGSIPADNPFIDDSSFLPEIWSYGHRNPQGLVFDSATQKLWSIEHGPRGGDEINLIEKAKNYGWPKVSQGKEYFADIDVGVEAIAGFQDPVKVYTPSIAPSDLAVYSHHLFDGWQGDLLTGALKLRHLNRVKVNDSLQIMHEKRYLQELNERIRSVLVGNAGELWLGTDSGKILRLTP